MKCSLANRMLALRAGDELWGVLARRVDRHCAGCPACSKSLAALRADRARMRAALAMPAVLPTKRTESGDPLGDPFWHAIRRELRTDGLCGPTAQPRASALEIGRRRAFAARSMLATASIAAAALFFLHPGETALAPTVTAPDVAVAGPEPIPGVEKTVIAPKADAQGDRKRAQIEESQPFAPPGVQYHIEGWRSSAADQEPESF